MGLGDLSPPNKNIAPPPTICSPLGLIFFARFVSTKLMISIGALHKINSVRKILVQTSAKISPPNQKY